MSQKTVLNLIVQTSAWQSRALLHVNTLDKDFTAKEKGKKQGLHTVCV